MKLISMTGFVLEQYEKIEYEGNLPTFTTSVHNYAQFLKQPLELWMFVPCKLVDGVWVVLEEPKEYNKWHMDEEYQQAKERCLFEGFEYNNETEQLKKGRLFLFFSPSCCEVYLDGDTEYLEFIEEIADYDIQLTTTAQKQIGCDH